MTIQHTLSKEELADVAIVVVHGLERIEDELIKHFPERTLFVMMFDDDTIEFLDESDMAEHGWIRK